MAQLRLETRLFDSRLSPYIYSEHLLRAGHFAGLQIHFAGLILPPTLTGRFSNPIVLMSRQDSPSPASPTLHPPGLGVGGSHSGDTGTGTQGSLASHSRSPRPFPGPCLPPPGRSHTCRGPCRASASSVVPEGARCRGWGAACRARRLCPEAPLTPPSPSSSVLVAEAASIAAGGGREAAGCRRRGFLFLTQLGRGGMSGDGAQPGHPPTSQGPGDEG